MEPVDVQVLDNASSVKTACLYILRTGSLVRNASCTVLRWLVALSHVDILALRRILEPKRKVVTGGWEKLRSEKIMSCVLRQVLLG